MTQRSRVTRTPSVRPRPRHPDPASRCRVEPLETRTLMSVSQDGGGWTVVMPSADSRVIHVSSSAGDDANTGSESSPVKTLARGRGLLRDGMPDHLLLKRGDVWYESLGGTRWSLSGRDADEPMYLGAYGPITDARP